MGTQEDFKLTFEVSVIEHLGLNLYSEVHSAISELIANAYDAEAEQVTVELPIGTPFGLEGQTIVVTDNGHGMTYEECRDHYLRIGRNRRRSSRRSKNNKRNVIGKKGIGKLAGFGVANRMKVRTVSHGRLTEFELDLEGIRNARPLPGSFSEDRTLADGDDGDIVREYEPIVLHRDEEVDEEDGTKIVLKHLRPLDKIEWDDFITKLNRRFAILDDEFEVTIRNQNSGEGRVLRRFDLTCQFRFPKTDEGPQSDGWFEDEIDVPNREGKQQIKYWIGFAEETIKRDAERGIVVIANKKLVQEPFDFRVTGGVTGQFGLQYMTGEVMADWLDEGSLDVIASDRASVRWTDPGAAVLLQWGKEKVKELLQKWAELRSEETLKSLRSKNPEIEEEIESYGGAAQKELRMVVDRAVTALHHISETRRLEVVQSIVQAYRHDHIRDVLKKIVDMPTDEGFVAFGHALAEWDMIDAVLTFQELSVKYAAVQTLKLLILGQATEVKSKSGDLSLHEHLAEHPWLLDPDFSKMESEISIGKFILEQYGKDEKIKKNSNELSNMRMDFVAVYDKSCVRLIEIKSAKDPLDLRGINNLQTYHAVIKDMEGLQNKPRPVNSVLIYNGEVSQDARGPLEGVRRDQEMDVFTWNDLLRRNETIYKELLHRAKSKNPDDPRVKRLYDTMQDRYGKALSKSDVETLSNNDIQEQPMAVPVEERDS